MALGAHPSATNSGHGLYGVAAGGPDPDGEVVLRVRGGDVEAFGELVRRYQQAVFGTCWRLVGDRREAEDLTQESFVRAYQNLDRFDASRAFWPWVRRLAVNVCLNRVATRLGRDVPVGDGRAVPSDEGRPEATLLGSERRDAVRAAILALPPHYRAVIELRHYQELSYDEIASTLDLSLSAVRTHLFRARRVLARSLSGHV